MEKRYVLKPRLATSLAFGVVVGLTVFDRPAIAVGVAVFDLVGGSGYPKQEALREGIGGGWSGARGDARGGRRREPGGELADS
jgi:hypothetical protein